jgi:hypothetical protein
MKSIISGCPIAKPIFRGGLPPSGVSSAFTERGYELPTRRASPFATGHTQPATEYFNLVNDKTSQHSPAIRALAGRSSRSRIQCWTAGPTLPALAKLVFGLEDLPRKVIRPDSEVRPAHLTHTASASCKARVRSLAGPPDESTHTPTYHTTLPSPPPPPRKQNPSARAIARL